MIHWLAHLLHWQNGTVESWWSEDGHLMLGFKCSTCGTLTGIVKTETTRIGTRS